MSDSGIRRDIQRSPLLHHSHRVSAFQYFFFFLFSIISLVHSYYILFYFIFIGETKFLSGEAAESSTRLVPWPVNSSSIKGVKYFAAEMQIRTSNP